MINFCYLNFGFNSPKDFKLVYQITVMNLTMISLHVVVCHFCFENFEVEIETDGLFTGKNLEIFDCTVCCNPNKVEYSVWDGIPSIRNVGDGNA